MTWKFGLCDLAGVPIGEVHKAYERTLMLPLNGLPVASFRIRLDDPLADEISSRDGDCLVKVYQDATLRFIGDVVTVDEVGQSDGDSIAVNAAGPLWRLQKRLLGTGYYSQGAFGRAQTVANTIITDMLTAVNTTNLAGVPKDTGVQAVSFDSLYPADVGPWQFKPFAEALAEMQAAKIAFPVNAPPSSYLLDAFGGSGAVNGRTDDLGNHWATGGSGPDWDVGASKAARNSLSDGASRWAVSDHAATGASLYGVDQLSSARSVDSQALAFNLYARVNGHTVATVESGQWIKVRVLYDTEHGRIQLEKRVGGVSTTIGNYDIVDTWLEAGREYSIRLLIDEDGNYSVWHYITPMAGAVPGPLIIGRDTDLATGGPLATGTMAWGDLNNSVTTIGRQFDNPFASDYTGPVSFDFELAPIEPTGSPLKIADLHVLSQIGTVKPDAIFEYGTGGRTCKSYKRTTSREGLVNQAWSLNQEFPDWPEGQTTSDVRSATDTTSITARGLFEEVITSDVVDGQLRQALIDSHVNVRKVPRQLITFEPSENAPQFGDYIVGDFVTGRAVVNGTVRFDATFRVYKVDISVDDEGKATIVPTLTVE